MDPNDIAEQVADHFISGMKKMLKKMYEDENMSEKYTLQEFLEKYML